MAFSGPTHDARALRALLALVVCLLVASPAGAQRLQLSALGAASLTYNNNITLSRADVNFGPGVLAREDLIGAARVRAALRHEGTELAYTGSRTRFTKNPELGFAENVLELTHEKLARRWVLLQAQVLFARVDPDELVRADVNGVFPFTTAEPPDRQILQLSASTPPERKNQFSLRSLSQRQQYSNNPLLDSVARAFQVRLGRKLGSRCTVSVEAQNIDRSYPNLVGPTPGSTIEAPAQNAALQLTYTPNQHFGFLAKALLLDQTSNVDAFFLVQNDLSLGVTYESNHWNAALLAQASRRDFERRPVAGENQLDRDLLTVLSVTRTLGLRSAATLALTHDRNQSNVVDFAYSNDIVRLEFNRSF